MSLRVSDELPRLFRALEDNNNADLKDFVWLALTRPTRRRRLCQQCLPLLIR